MDKRPIADAPRDGTWVVLYGGTTNEDFYGDDDVSGCRGRAVVGRWIPGYDDTDWQLEPSDPNYGREVDTWAVSYWDGEWRTKYLDPTHWAPLELT